MGRDSLDFFFTEQVKRGTLSSDDMSVDLISQFQSIRAGSPLFPLEDSMDEWRSYSAAFVSRRGKSLRESLRNIIEISQGGCYERLVLI